jgi:glutathione synthase/RimK-type ligase-like ATP-grasp enzyme
MSILIIVDNPSLWPLHLPGVQVVSARAYLTDPWYSQLRRARIFNLCRSYRYQTIGYYVSLLAEARGHKPQPSIATIQDLKMQTLTRLYSEELAELAQRSLAHIRSEKFVLNIYFGRTLAKSYDKLSQELFRLFQAPLLQGVFSYDDGRWRLKQIQPIPASEIPESHEAFVVLAATQYFSTRRWTRPKRTQPRYDLAILWDPLERESPSNERAIRRFARAGQALGLRAEVIAKEDYSVLAEFDALFIRQTTSVNHHTYRFARRAEAEGLVVIDDPGSILKCTNKVYLAELMNHHGVRTPQTMIVHKDNITATFNALGAPLILKQPDSSFSQGVVKADDLESLRALASRMLDRSDLLIAQEFLPTEFDWRVGVFDGRPLFVCKYYMVRKHWQVIQRHPTGRKDEGRFETLAVESAPRQVVDTAVRAANLIGNGLYGVDLKQVGRKCYVIEINDNPNLDAGIEDAVLKEQLYFQIMEGFIRRIERQKGGPASLDRLAGAVTL